MRDPEFIETLRKIPADVMVVVAFGQIIPKEILEMKKYGCINVHASLLPKYRGAAPIQWAVIDGSKQNRWRYHHADGCRTGYRGYAVKDRGSPGKRGNRWQPSDKLSAAGATLLLQTLEGLERGEIVPQKQGETTTAYAKMLTKDMGEIRWERRCRSYRASGKGLKPLAQRLYPCTWKNAEGVESRSLQGRRQETGNGSENF